MEVRELKNTEMKTKDTPIMNMLELVDEEAFLDG